jgi:SH3-like domain-containing protein
LPRSALAALAIAVLLLTGIPGLAGEPAVDRTTTGAITLGPSGLQLPRFVSLKSGRVNSRIGPGLNYSVDWLYLKAGLPMEIIQEYDTWRRVRDADGAEGWINQALLSGKRTGIVVPWQRGKGTTVKLLNQPDETASVAAMVEPGAIGTIETCNGNWCQIRFSRGTEGWLAQSSVWGAYPGEVIKD